jgi:hypothetical protein
LSRAAIIAALILFFYLLFRKQKMAVKAFIFFIFLFCIRVVFSVFIFDASFLTKIEIFTRTVEYLENASSKQLVLGNGFASSIAFLGMAAHNYISFLLIEMGFVSFILFFLLFFCVYFFTRKAFIYILIPYLIAGLSMAPGAIPYFYAIAGMMYIFQKNGYYYGKTK